MKKVKRIVRVSSSGALYIQGSNYGCGWIGNTRDKMKNNFNGGIPTKQYEVTYSLNKRGKYLLLPGSCSDKLLYPIPHSREDRSLMHLGCVCFLPWEWRNKRVSRKVRTL